MFASSFEDQELKQKGGVKFLPPFLLFRSFEIRRFENIEIYLREDQEEGRARGQILPEAGSPLCSFSSPSPPPLMSQIGF